MHGLPKEWLTVCYRGCMDPGIPWTSRKSSMWISVPRKSGKRILFPNSPGKCREIVRKHFSRDFYTDQKAANVFGKNPLKLEEYFVTFTQLVMSCLLAFNDKLFTVGMVHPSKWLNNQGESNQQWLHCTSSISTTFAEMCENYCRSLWCYLRDVAVSYVKWVSKSLHLLLWLLILGCIDSQLFKQ